VARSRVGACALNWEESSAQRPNVRFGSKADIARDQLNVRFTPKSGHWNSTV
jgi:hypothetical protein